MDEEQEENSLIEAIDRLWNWENILSKVPPTLPRIQQIPPPPSSCTLLSLDANSLTKPRASPINTTNQPEPVVTSNFRSFSLSPSTKEHPISRKAKVRRHKSLPELENEELKGFMDLGFIFNGKEASPYERSILPGLQTPEEKTKVVSRPYLSEAWLINRPDSPLLNLRIPAISAASGADMKKHLRTWARMVASSVELDFSGDILHT